MPSAYHQVHLPEKYQDRISFTSPWGTYKCKRLPFGLKTSASNFQALMDSILEEINMPGMFCYQDDVIICSNSFEETLAKLTKFLEMFKKYNLTLNLTKCSFHQTSANFLGFHIEKNRIFPINSNIKKIHAFPIPKTKRQVKRFLGSTSFYRHLIPKFAELTEPLAALTSPKKPFQWSEEQNEAFAKLQKIFFNKPFLQQPDFNKTFYLNTDASEFAISATILQKHGEDLLPIAYFSKALRKAETKYPPIKLELMAIAKGMAAFRDILYGRHFVLLSDSKPLKEYSKVTSPANIITRWLLAIGEYDFTFEHIPGKDNVLADFLSRTPLEQHSEDIVTDPNLVKSNDILPIVQEEEEQDERPSSQHINALQQNDSTNSNSTNVQKPPPDPLLEISIKTLKYNQLKDKYTNKIIKDLQNNRISKHVNFTICPNSSLLVYQPDNAVHPRIVVPDALREKCIRIHHVTHFGVNKTFKNISQKYYWKGLFADVQNFVNSCHKCILAKPQRIPAAPLQNQYIPTRPGQFISLDFVGPFKNGKHILTAIDHHSKHLKLYPIKNITAMNAANAIFDYICTFGRPELVLSDNGSQFKSYILEEFSKMLGIRLEHTTVANPQANAVSERINTSIKNTIKILMEDGYKFEYALKIHENIYNNTFHSTIKATPNRMHFGRATSSIFDTFHPCDLTLRLDVHRDYYNLMQNLDKLYKQIYDNLIDFQKLQNRRQHCKAKMRKLSVGDIVFLENKGKIKTSFQGPFKIIKKVTNVIFDIQPDEEPTGPIQRVHMNRLRRAPARKPHLRSHDPENLQVHNTPSQEITNDINQQNLLPTNNHLSVPVNNASVSDTQHNETDLPDTSSDCIDSSQEDELSSSTPDVPLNRYNLRVNPKNTTRYQA